MQTISSNQTFPHAQALVRNNYEENYEEKTLLISFTLNIKSHKLIRSVSYMAKNRSIPWTYSHHLVISVPAERKNKALFE